MKALKVHVLGMLGMVLLLAAIGIGADIYGLYSGITSQTIDVDMWNSSTGATCAVVIDPNDVDVYYIEQGKAETSFDPNECTSEMAGWVSQTVLSHPSGASMRVDLPDAALDGGIHKWVKVRVKSTTYEGHAMIWLSAPMDAHLSGGSTPPTLANVLEGDFSSGTFPAMTLADDAITNAKVADSAALEIADRAAGLWLSDPNLPNEVATAVMAAAGLASDEKPQKAPVSGGTGTITGYTATGTSITGVVLAASASSTDDIFNDKFITFSKTGVPPIATRIVTYTGNNKLATIFPYVSSTYITSGVTTYKISDESNTSQATSFGPNAKLALLEDVERESAVDLIYLAAPTVEGLDAKLYASGTTVVFADSDGVYHYAIVATIDSEYHNLSLRRSTPAAPADGTPIYPLGINIATSVWDALPSTFDEANSMGGVLDSIYDDISKMGAFDWTDSSAITTGSTANTIVFADGIAYETLNPEYCPIRFFDTSGTKIYYRICTGYNSSTNTMTIFPKLPVVPAAADTVHVLENFGGLIPTDITKAVPR